MCDYASVDAIMSYDALVRQCKNEPIPKHKQNFEFPRYWYFNVIVLGTSLNFGYNVLTLAGAICPFILNAGILR